MDIKLYVSKEGDVYIACVDGVFKKPIEKVILDRSSQFMSLKLLNVEEPVGLNCPVDPELMTIMENQKNCTFGIHYNGKTYAEFRIPFDQINTQEA